MDKRIKIALYTILVIVFISLAWGEADKERGLTATDGSGVQKVEVLAGSYYFKPDLIIVKLKEPVEITVRKEEGIVPHRVVLHAPEAGIDFETDLSSTPKIIRFTPVKTGSYPFFCNHRFLFWTHRAKGMEGVLKVIE